VIKGREPRTKPVRFIASSRSRDQNPLSMATFGLIGQRCMQVLASKPLSGCRHRVTEQTKSAHGAEALPADAPEKEWLTATSPIDTTIDVCASTCGSIARGSGCWHPWGAVTSSSSCRHSRSPVSGSPVSGSPVNTGRSHDGDRCDHDTGGWHDDAGTLIGVIAATADELGGIDSNPSQGR
jgi:hypothetical protein